MSERQQRARVTPGDRRAHRDPAGRRLPPPHLRGARRRRARPARASSWPSRSVATTSREPAAPVLLDPQGQPVGHLRRHRRHRRLGRRRRAPSGSAACAPHDEVDIVGPLGRPFPLPNEPVACVLVGGGYGSAPAVLARRGAARARLPRRDGARRRHRGRLFGVVEARRYADGVTVTTDDGSAGHQGLGLRRAAARSSAAPVPRSSTAAGRWGCSSRSPTSPRPRAPSPRWRSRSRWPAASASA